ncbi:MAG TPA: DUF4175 family protein [Chryseolinea sp.]|nr:DUF4175 family protein [Chryseolinea sp.]
MSAGPRYYLQSTLRKYKLIRLSETAFVSIGMGLIIFTTLSLSAIPNKICAIVAFTTSIVFVAIRSFQLHVFQITLDDIVGYINQQYPQLQQGGDLLLRDDDDLTSLQQLQKLRSAEQFENIYPTLRLPNKFKSTVIFLTISLAACISLLYFFSSQASDQALSSGREPEKSMQRTKLPASISSVEVTILPPAYTGLIQRKQTGFALNVPQGSDVTWKLKFNQSISTAKLILYGHDTLAMAETPNGFTCQRKLAATAFYQVSWRGEDAQTKYSDYYEIEVIQDQPPVIKVIDLDQFIELSTDDKTKIELKSTLTDDYSLKDAYVIATVSKGSGEAVKFREEKLMFDAPRRITGRTVSASLQIDVRKLGMDPGDELYFYVEALDTKVPEPNKSRTETFFISIKDTAQVMTSVDPGLSVDLMPEYFRSQRQIIIDTEKLLKEKNRISKETFNSKSNELGYDQKILRLRYGEFLGEEFETSIGPGAHTMPDNDDQEEDITKQFGHQHDTEKEHESAVETEAHKPGAVTKDAEDPAKAYMHSHDSDDEETFFTQSIRSKLKAAVTIMWDAELYLRLYEPAKSLPFQYKALKLLKEISQDSRVYVHRTGFDPPPLKEEKRLSGDLSELANSTTTNVSINQDSFVNIRKALAYIDGHAMTAGVKISPEISTILVAAGNELSREALAQPGRYLKSLSLLKSLAGNELDDAARSTAIQTIRATFYSVLPREPYNPRTAKRSTQHPLQEQFLRNLQDLSREQRK